MGIKFLIFALVAVFSIQGLVEAKHISIHEERGIVEDITAVVEEIKASVNKLNDEGLTMVKKNADQIAVVAGDEMNKALSDIQQLGEEAIADINEIKEAAGELGIDVDECIDEQLPRIQELSQKYYQAIQGCFDQLHAEFANVYRELFIATTGSYTVFFNLMQKYEACPDSACRMIVAKDLVREMIRIKREIRLIIERAVLNIREQLPITVECMKGNVAAFKVEVAAIVADVKACVEASNKTRIATKSIEEEIKQLIEKVKQAISDIIHGALADLKKAYDALVAFVKKLVANAEAKIQELADKLRRDIEEIKKAAEALGMDIQQCINEAAPKIEALVAQTRADLKICADQTLAFAGALYQQAVVIINEVQAEMQTLIETVQNCKDLVCYINAAKPFKAVLKRIFGEIRDLIRNGAVELRKAIGAFIKCSKPVMGHYANGLREISVDAFKCLTS